LVPDHGFVHDYIRNYIYGTDPPLTDAPASYHVTMALSLLGVTLSEVTYAPGAGEPLQPNLYFLLIGKSRRHRKGTAIRLAMKVLRQDDELARFLGPEEYSAEALLSHLSAQPCCLLPVTEFGDLLAIVRGWGVRLKPVLMSLYDCPETYTKQLSKRAFTITQPRVSMVAAVNVALMNELPDTIIDWSSGFLARFAMIMPGTLDGTTVSLNYCPDLIRHPSMADPATLQDLASTLMDLRRRATPITGLSREAYAIKEDWLDKYEKVGEGVEGLLESVYHGLSTLLTKVATLYNADLAPGEPKVTGEAMRYACAFTDLAWESAKAMEAVFAPTASGKLMARVTDMLDKAGETGVPYREILRRLRITVGELQPILDTLEAAKLVEKGTLPRSGKHYWITGKKPRSTSRPQDTVN
jgi:hypothetical protein